MTEIVHPVVAKQAPSTVRRRSVLATPPPSTTFDGPFSPTFDASCCHCDCVMHNPAAGIMRGGRRTPGSPLSDVAGPASPWSSATPEAVVSRPSSAHSTRSCDTTASSGWLCHCAASCSSSVRPFAGKTIILLRTSSTARAPVYASLRRKGLRIVMVHPFANVEQFPAECIDEWIVHDTSDVDALYALLAPRRGTFDAVASFDEYGVFPAAQLNQRFGLRPLPMSPAALSTVNIKSRFRQWCATHGVNAPRSLPLRTPAVDAVAAVRAAGLLYPLVAKPAPGAGSNLVQLVDTDEELAACVQRLWAAIDAMRPTAVHFEALGEPIHILLEEFVEGPEVDVDAIVEDNVIRFAGVSDNFPTVRPYFSEVGGLAPSALPAPQQDSLVQLLEAFVDGMRRDGEHLTGVLHFEAKYDVRRNLAVTIEVNCRMGSAETHTMVATGFGVDLSEAAMRLALGMPLQRLPEEHVTGKAPVGTGVFAASANLYPARAGALVEIRPPPPQQHLIRAMPFPMAKGAPVKLAPDSFGCLLWLVAEGGSPAEAVARMKSMCDQTAIVVE